MLQGHWRGLHSRRCNLPVGAQRVCSVAQCTAIILHRSQNHSCISTELSRSTLECRARYSHHSRDYLVIRLDRVRSGQHKHQSCRWPQVFYADKPLGQLAWTAHEGQLSSCNIWKHGAQKHVIFQLSCSNQEPLLTPGDAHCIFDGELCLSDSTGCSRHCAAHNSSQTVDSQLQWRQHIFVKHFRRACCCRACGRRGQRCRSRSQAFCVTASCSRARRCRACVAVECWAPGSRTWHGSCFFLHVLCLHRSGGRHHKPASLIITA
mmetsp:Transcript_128092/g.246776  ORF Transcript_128092/g.246776 Transcript_128092/m.246776 type:complete len:264 (+) Transcript_128092:971-1762(+)